MQRIDNCRALLSRGGREQVGLKHEDRRADLVF